MFLHWLYFLLHCQYLQEPLNSDDDVSEDDPNELFDTENVVVCQYDKVSVLLRKVIILQK